ncbi:hypothetical protein ACI2JB_14490 [Pantoea agglomerans]|uniref:hypothetical protein n=1 Tax=Enterobacter agglomerans TaxID=549 RepID=UPI00384C36A0
MARLYDMEELVGQVIDEDVKQYMREALTCYMTGAYRATIVLTYIALFDDIYKKLEQLAKVNKVANRIFIASSKKRQEQEVFEYDLISSLKSSSLMSEMEVTFVDILRQLRNKSAHPSGHLPSAEEARFIFYEAISRFLSKPILSTKTIVEQITSRMSESNFFHSPDIAVMAKVANKELSNIHPEAIPFLISKLVDSLSNDDVQSNSKKFLCSMAFSPPTENTLTQLREKIIEAKASDPEYYELICELLSSNGDLYKELHDVSYGRINNLLMETVKKTGLQIQYDFLLHPITVFESLMRSNSPKEILEKNEDSFNSLLEKFLYSSYFIEVLKDYILVRGIIGRKLIDNAGSNSFEIANDFAKKIYNLDKVISENYTDRFCFRLLSSVLKASNSGAFSSESLIKTKFNSLPYIKEKAKKYNFESPDAAKDQFVIILEKDDEFDYFINIVMK